MAGQELDACAILNVASGGIAAREAKEVAVKPTGRPSGATDVTTATPAAWRLNALLKASIPSVAVELSISLLSSLICAREFPVQNELTW